jgi:hypothetical protein
MFDPGSRVPSNDLVSRAPGTISSRLIVADGEDLLYEVRWTVFKLGTVHLWTRRNYTAEAQVDSYEGVPFVDLHSIHYTTMDTLFYSRGCRSIQKNEQGWAGIDYVYEPARRRLLVEETVQQSVTSPPVSRTLKDSLDLPTMDFVDGVSIAYVPRTLIHTVQSVVVPTVLYGKLGNTTYNCTNNRTTEKIGALDDPVRVVEIDGTTSVKGIFGMTGDFSGWFSDDEAAVPIKGKLNVILGSVNIELIKWSRSGWNPPVEKR